MAIQSFSNNLSSAAFTSVGNAGNAAAPAQQPGPSADVAPSNGRSSQTSAATAAYETEPSFSDVKRAAEEVQKVLQARADNLQFSVDQDDDAGRAIVKLKDKQSGEVILQIPSKEMISIAKEIDKLLGVFVKQKV